MDHLPKRSDLITIVPANFYLLATGVDNSATVIEAHYNYKPVYETDGTLVADYLGHFDLKTPQTMFLRIFSSKGISEVIPITIQFRVEPLEIFNSDGSPLVALQFGQVSVDFGEKKQIFIENPNPFHLKSKFSVTNPQFQIDPVERMFKAGSKNAIDVEFLPFVIPETEKMPKVQHFWSMMSVTFHLVGFDSIDIPLEGDLVDVSGNLLRLRNRLSCRLNLNLVPYSLFITQSCL